MTDTPRIPPPCRPYVARSLPPGRFDPADPAHRYRVTRIRRRARLTHQRSVRRPCRLGPRDACWHNRPSLRRQRVGGLGRRLPSRSAPPPSPGPCSYARGSGSLESPGGVVISGHRSVLLLDPALAPQRRRSQRHRSVNGRAARDARAANAAGRCEGWTGRGRDSPERYEPPSPAARRLAFAAKRSRQRECPTARRRPQTAGARSRVPRPNG
jgi:hypothetical protein